MALFLFLTEFFWLEVPVLSWVEVGRVMIFFLVLILEKKFQHFTVMMLAVVLSYMAITMLRYILFVLILLSFHHEMILNFIRFFLHLLRWSYNIDLSGNIVFYIYWFANIKPILHPSNIFHLKMAYDPFNLLFNSIC